MINTLIVHLTNPYIFVAWLYYDYVLIALKTLVDLLAKVIHVYVYKSYTQYSEHLKLHFSSRWNPIDTKEHTEQTVDTLNFYLSILFQISFEVFSEWFFCLQSFKIEWTEIVRKNIP